MTALNGIHNWDVARKCPNQSTKAEKRIPSMYKCVALFTKEHQRQFAADFSSGHKLGRSNDLTASSSTLPCTKYSSLDPEPHTLARSSARHHLGARNKWGVTLFHMNEKAEP
eukprot:6178225-Pleurochrysis_carterae.AAC.1